MGLITRKVAHSSGVAEEDEEEDDDDALLARAYKLRDDVPLQLMPWLYSCQAEATDNAAFNDDGEQLIRL